MRVGKALADSGFVALAIDYYGDSGRGSTPAEEMCQWPAWQATVRNAIGFLAHVPAVAGKPIALGGYSRGTTLAISVGASGSPDRGHRPCAVWLR